VPALDTRVMLAFAFARFVNFWVVARSVRLCDRAILYFSIVNGDLLIGACTLFDHKNQISTAECCFKLLCMRRMCCRCVDI
jgi:hypothetical protein